MSDQVEEWRPVVGYEGLYEVSSLGRVRSLDRVIANPMSGTAIRSGRLIVATPDRSGYLQLALCRRGGRIVRRVHTLVATAFIGPRPPECQVCHGNGNKADNRVENLRWGTKAENEMDKAAHGTSNRGERNAKARIGESDALAIMHSDEPSVVLAARYGVDGSMISHIRRGRTWTWLRAKHGIPISPCRRPGKCKRTESCKTS